MPKITSKDNLTDKQRATFKDYLNPSSDSFLDMTKSVKKYYKTSSHNSASVIATQIKPNLAKLDLVKLNSDTPEAEKLIVNLTPEYVINRLLKIAEGEAPKSSIKIKGSDALKALELIGKLKNLQLFREESRVETVKTDESTEDLTKEFRELASKSTEPAPN